MKRYSYCDYTDAESSWPYGPPSATPLSIPSNAYADAGGHKDSPVPHLPRFPASIIAEQAGIIPTPNTAAPGNHQSDPFAHLPTECYQTSSIDVSRPIPFGTFITYSS